MKTLLSIGICLLLLVAPAHARKKTFDDFLVLNNNDTIYGKVLTGGSFTANRIWVRVKKEDGSKLRFQMEEVKAFRDRGIDYLRKEFIHIRWPMKTYLRVDQVGKMTLMYMRCQTARLGYDLFVELENGELVIINAHNFYTLLYPLFKASPSFMEQVGGDVFYPRLNRHYYKEMYKYISWYNGISL